MRKIIFKFAALFVLAGGGYLIHGGVSTEAAFACWETAYNRWMACDNGYSNTLNQYANQSNYCSTNSANNCSAIANSYCSQQANTSCSGNPDPACYNNAYNSCYMPYYQSCYTNDYNTCINNVNSAYSNRGNAYGSCLGFEGNGGNCIEEMDECEIARDRVSACNSLYVGIENSDALNTCLNNSGISQCE
ncbi:MAG: hypothetical protein KIS76_18510 [Pyrinomonadaceae bacterium]|nr:hypothetical protein [Pyrinomonadaceae bacterium]